MEIEGEGLGQVVEDLNDEIAAGVGHQVNGLALSGCSTVVVVWFPIRGHNLNDLGILLLLLVVLRSLTLSLKSKKTNILTHEVLIRIASHLTIAQCHCNVLLVFVCRKKVEIMILFVVVVVDKNLK